MRVMASIAREALEDAVRALGGDLAWPDSVNRPQTLNLKVEIDESDAWERLSQFVDIPRSEFDLRDLGDFAGAMVGGDTESMAAWLWSGDTPTSSRLWPGFISFRIWLNCSGEIGSSAISPSTA